MLVLPILIIPSIDFIHRRVAAFQSDGSKDMVIEMMARANVAKLQCS